MVDANDDFADGMQCSDHPSRPNPGGICALCLQEKLGKLVSSSFPVPLPSASSSPSFRSDFPATASTLSLSLAHHRYSNTHHSKTPGNRIPFLLAKKKKNVSAATADRASSAAAFTRSKSTNAAPRRARFSDDEDYSPRKRGGFWSFLHLSSSKTTTASSKCPTNAATVTAASSSSRGGIADAAAEDSRVTVASPSSFERKVSRSRSVGCGSRSFSGDFFERLSTGFGDCTLRRVESQREGKPKPSTAHNCTMKERVRCGGIFSGFIMTSSSSSSSSSSYWVSEVNGKPTDGRSRSWGWAFASPMRAFTKPSGKDGKRDIVRQASDKNAATTPNLAAIPSLLAARG